MDYTYPLNVYSADDRDIPIKHVSVTAMLQRVANLLQHAGLSTKRHLKKELQCTPPFPRQSKV